jgi:hypothetical protein
MKLGWARGVPRIAREVVSCDLGRQARARIAERIHVELHMARAKWMEVGQTEMKKADRRTKAPPVLWVVRAEELLLQMDKRAGHLDQAFEEAMILVMTLQPQILQNVMGFVITPFIKASKVALIARIEREARVSAQLLDEGVDTIGFFHGRVGRQHREAHTGRHFFRRSREQAS